MKWPLGDVLVDLSRFGGLFWRVAVEPRLSAEKDGLKERYFLRQRRILDRLHPQRMKLEVVECRDETPTSRTFALRRLDGPVPHHRPGQYINLFVSIGETQTSRPYSICSTPGADLLLLTVRAQQDGFVSPWLCRELAPGALLESTGPLGDFVHEPLIHGRDLVFIAGGCGITAFISMLRASALKPSMAPRIQLVYGSRHADDVIFGSELDALTEKLPGFRWTPLFSGAPGLPSPTGLIDLETLRALTGEVQGKSFFLSGPDAMIRLARQALTALGVPDRRCRTELFGLSEEVTLEPGWPAGLSPQQRFTLEIEGHGPIEARAGETLMTALERAGLSIPTECRCGQCSTCAVPLVRGKVLVASSAGQRRSELARGMVHACATYPLEDLTIRLDGLGRPAKGSSGSGRSSP